MFGARYSNGFLALVLCTISHTQTTMVVQAQSNGTCVCQPGVIEFTLDFALGCDNRTILPGLPGIEDALCVVTSTGGSTTFDNVPVSVSAITVSEIDFNLNSLKMENFTGTFLSGDTFTYEAFSVSDTDSVANGTIPNGLQVAITGLNADNEEITNNIVVLFTNDCTIYPVLETDSTIGWASLTTVTGPPAEFCPAFTPPESDVPSSFPSSSPTSDNLCNCQPGTMTLTIDYALTCEDSTILTGDPGIEEAKCDTYSKVGPNITDTVPVSVVQVLIYEYDASLDIIKETNITAPFASGDTILYESFAVTDTDVVLSGQVPQGIQVTINGFNAAGDDLQNSYVIVYTNECDVYPVLTDGSNIGWSSLSMVTGPPNGLCPAFDSESTVPSIVPSSVPIAIESTLPSIVPSNVPVAVSTLPSIVPSNVPVAESTVPSIVPSGVPLATTIVPTTTSVPVMLETDTPIEAPIPVEPPAMAPVSPPTDVIAPSCPPIGKGGKGKGGKGKGDSERLLKTGGGGGGEECPEPTEPKMKKKKGKDNMSMDIEKKKGMKMSKADKEKVKAAAPTSKVMPKVGMASKGKAVSKDEGTSKGKGKVGDDSGKGKMGMGQGKAKKTKGDKAEPKTMEKPVKKEKATDEADKTRKMEVSERRQLRSLPQ